MTANGRKSIKGFKKVHREYKRRTYDYRFKFDVLQFYKSDEGSMKSTLTLLRSKHSILLCFVFHVINLCSTNVFSIVNHETYLVLKILPNV